MTQATEVLSPTSADEAVAQFGDGSGVTVIGGGTIVVPEITYGRRSPTKALLLGRAGLDTLSVDGATVTRRRGPARAPAVRARAGRRGARAVRPQRRRLRDSPSGHRGRQRLRSARRATHRAATCRAPSSRSRRRRARSAPAARRASRSRTSWRIARAVCSSSSASRSRRRRRSPRSSIRTPTSTPCSP